MCSRPVTKFYYGDSDLLHEKESRGNLPDLAS